MLTGTKYIAFVRDASCTIVPICMSVWILLCRFEIYEIGSPSSREAEFYEHIIMFFENVTAKYSITNKIMFLAWRQTQICVMAKNHNENPMEMREVTNTQFISLLLLMENYEIWIELKNKNSLNSRVERTLYYNST